MRGGPTVFALGDVAAFVAALRVGGVAPGSDAIPVGVPAVVQLQAMGGEGAPPEKKPDYSDSEEVKPSQTPPALPNISPVIVGELGPPLLAG